MRQWALEDSDFDSIRADPRFPNGGISFRLIRADGEGMDVATSIESSSQSNVARGVSLLRKQLDNAQSSAAQLLEVLPQKVSLEPNKGSRFDTYA